MGSTNEALLNYNKAVNLSIKYMGEGHKDVIICTNEAIKFC